MSIIRRPSEARGREHIDWLDSRHTFSFAHYYDPAHMGFRSLRVINDDTVQAGAGFPPHGHRDMEIISYVVRGALAHEDSTGGKGVIRRGDVQSMSAGTGVRHSEFNASDDEDVRFLQIWIMPKAPGLPATYRQAHFDDADKHNRLRLIVAPGGPDGALDINRDARIYASVLDAGASVAHDVAAGRAAWVQVVDGSIRVNGEQLKAGDGAAIERTDRLEITAAEKAEFLLFDLGN
jgi:redox-sensitive bicupin YhaK (pirin superfamily)